MKKINLKKLGFSRYTLTDAGEIVRIKDGTERKIVPATDSRGYCSVRLKNDEGRIVLWKLHRLVSEVFIRHLQPG